VFQLEEEEKKREMVDAQSNLAFHQARIEEETARRLESAQFASQAGRTCHPFLRRVPRANEDAPPVTVQSTLPSAGLDHEDALAMLNKVAYTGTDTASLSPYDSYQFTSLEEDKLRKLLVRIASPDDAAAAPKDKYGLKSPHPTCMTGTSGKNAGLDVVAKDGGAAVAAVAPRTDVPLVEQLYPALRAEDDVPSLQRLSQLRMVERIREVFARQQVAAGGKGGSGGGGVAPLPRSVIEQAILTPDDRPYGECIKLLPRPGAGLPKNPFADASKDKKKGKKGGKKK